MEKSIYVLTWCSQVIGAYGNKKKAYEKAKTLPIKDMVSYREICKTLNNKEYYKREMNLNKNHDSEYQLQLIPLNDKVDD
jgi:predicted phosphoadenosine phosphosulfate sulfurtransferase